MTLKEQIAEDMKTAMRARESARLGALRLLAAAIKQKEVDERIKVDDNLIISILEKMIKQRKDSIRQFEIGGRQDLVDIEQTELIFLSYYLPVQLSEAELQQEIESALTAVKATTSQDMGKAMAVLKPKLVGKADMALVSTLLKTALARLEA